MVEVTRAKSWSAAAITLAIVGSALFAAAPLAAGPVSTGSATSSPPPAVNPALSFADQAVIASGMTPGGRVVWLGVMRELNEGAVDWSDVETITADAGGVGTVELDLGKAVPAQSLWLAVDLATGQFASGAPAGYPLRTFAPPGGAFAAAASRVELARRLVILVCVRPGVGAWTLRVGDGGPGDADGVVDGTVRVDLAQLAALAGTPSALQALASQDVLLVVDEDQMDFIATSVN
jgi:hypothetical protein